MHWWLSCWNFQVLSPWITWLFGHASNENSWVTLMNSTFLSISSGTHFYLYNVQSTNLFLVNLYWKKKGNRCCLNCVKFEWGVMESKVKLSAKTRSRNLNEKQNEKGAKREREEETHSDGINRRTRTKQRENEELGMKKARSIWNIKPREMREEGKLQKYTAKEVKKVSKWFYKKESYITIKKKNVHLILHLHFFLNVCAFSYIDCIKICRNKLGQCNLPTCNSSFDGW